MLAGGCGAATLSIVVLKVKKSHAVRPLSLMGTDGQAQVRVSIVHTHQLMARALGAYLETQPGIKVISVGQQFDALLRSHSQTDVLLLGYITMLTNGITAVRELRARFPGLKLLVLINTIEEDVISSCIQFGAQGCVAKDSSLEDLVEAVRLAAAGRVLFSPEILMALLGRGERPESDAPREVTAEREVVNLGPRELEVLEALASGKATAEVAVQLSISPHTVRAHLKSALAKLNARSRTEAIALAMRYGLIQPAAHLA